APRALPAQEARCRRRAAGRGRGRDRVQPRHAGRRDPLAALPARRLLDQLLQDPGVHVGQALEVEAALPERVLAALAQDRIGTVAEQAVESEILLAGGEADREPVELASARVLELAGAESDDARSPHLRLRPGRALHHPHHGEAVVAPLLVLDLAEE